MFLHLKESFHLHSSEQSFRPYTQKTITKCKYTVFGKKTRTEQTQHLNVKINGISIKQIEVVKYLGILIDENLTWDAHINHVINKLLKFCSIFYKIRNLVPPSIMKKIYFALIHSHLVYGIELYANTFATYLDPLIKLNNKILRIIQFKPFRTPTKQLYSEFNTLPILISTSIMFCYWCINLNMINQVCPSIFVIYLDWIEIFIIFKHVNPIYIIWKVQEPNLVIWQ